MDNFFKENFVLSDEFGDKIKFSSLCTALKSYYETSRVFTDNFFSYIIKTPKGIFLTKVRGGDYILRYTESIIAIHLFFEHSIFDVLDKIHASLSRCEFKSEKLLIQLLARELPSQYISNRVSITKALGRLRNLIEYDITLPESFRVPKEYHFLSKHIDTIHFVAELRNEVVHSGEKVLDRYAYEVAFVNKILPLVRELLKRDPPNISVERNLGCGLNILDELIKIPLPIDYSKESNYEKLKIQLLKINQFKALGRATFYNELYMGENPELDLEDLEKHHNRAIKAKGKALAEFNISKFNHHKIYNCPCCGANSLSTFSIWNEIATNRQIVREAECSLCNYNVDETLGNPSDFGIMKEPIFVYIN